MILVNVLIPFPIFRLQLNYFAFYGHWLLKLLDVLLHLLGVICPTFCSFVTYFRLNVIRRFRKILEPWTALKMTCNDQIAHHFSSGRLKLEYSRVFFEKTHERFTQIIWKCYNWDSTVLINYRQTSFLSPNIALWLGQLRTWMFPEMVKWTFSTRSSCSFPWSL